MTSVQVLEIILGAVLAAAGVGVPLHLAARADRARLGKDHARHGERITALEIGHAYAFEHLKESLLRNSIQLDRFDQKLDQIAIKVARTGDYETRMDMP